jgi:hypothetical protein
LLDPFVTCLKKNSVAPKPAVDVPTLCTARTAEAAAAICH